MIVLKYWFQSAIAEFRALNRGAYGAILAGSERVQGRYPVTQAFLQLLISMVEVSKYCIMSSNWLEMHYDNTDSFVEH